MSEFPEAGAVVNVDYKRTDGFVVKLTLRDETGSKVLERLEIALAKIRAEGGTPYERSSFAKAAKPVEYVEGKMCPTCSSRLIHTSTKDGRKFIKCEKNKWDFTLKKSTGCPYAEWPNAD